MAVSRLRLAGRLALAHSLKSPLVVFFPGFISVVEEVVKWARELQFLCAVFLEDSRTLAGLPQHVSWCLARTMPAPPRCHFTATHAFLACLDTPAFPVRGGAREIEFPSTGTLRGLFVLCRWGILLEIVTDSEYPFVRPWHAAYCRGLVHRTRCLDPALASSLPFPRDATLESTPAPPPRCTTWSAAMPVHFLHNDPVRLLA
ncbi:hypothetical protein B0H11DRAFT_2234735 [Mycena galericulata]|nr:hypothetical protein B0H11DRAFT_2234735 [Mycena galericulata]